MPPDKRCRVFRSEGYSIAQLGGHFILLIRGNLAVLLTTHLFIYGKVAEKGVNFRFGHLVWMAHTVKTDEPLRPVAV